MKVDKQIRIFEKQAVRYDKKRERFELGEYRRRLLHTARGKVLELGAGAGSNLPYYDPDVALTAVDFSPSMLEKAKAANERIYGLHADFIQNDVDRLSWTKPEFDTVVSTLSLCAYRDPLNVLRKMSEWCKPGGQVLLMEHGISSNKAIAIAQKALDPLFCRFVGCHQNRDILGLITASPLQIERAEHYMSGMLHLLWCRAPGRFPG
ncbi:class I SAM-dependent methyltransferase [Paenibacillus arenilitoris]|uniref:Class I SAM-dependent methyltransferase n=1 Tax=Paenibacillus arenilitoris TaxID=2772299 RepID=A0A927H9U4_9BACL|nr:class I SAM-dependent methyltransferase [Paenibacillus arenilitoris]MBD2871969.1 class I SAM-dependent methyltransferase [Paenibacillus arenilitoris]